MTVNERYVLDVAALTLEAQALDEAALASDWEDARFRSLRINDLAFALGSQRVAQAARDVTRALGPAGHMPQPGYGAAMDNLSRAIGLDLEAP